MCAYEKLELIAESIINGQTKQYKTQIKLYRCKTEQD